MQKNKVFISYSGNLKIVKDFERRFRKHNEGVVSEVWSDLDFSVGDLDGTYYKYCKECDIAVLLVSSDYIASPYCNKDEFEILLKRYKKEEVKIIPVLFSHCKFNQWNKERLIFARIHEFEFKKISSSSPIQSSENNQLVAYIDLIDYEGSLARYHHLLSGWIEGVLKKK